MTVRELIAELSKHDPALPVVLDGYEGGVDDVVVVETVKIELNVNTKDYYGKHEIYDDYRAKYHPKAVTHDAVYLPR